jgi:hypothetical protein
VGDWLALAVCVESPTGVGSYKQPSGLLSPWEPTPWAIGLPWWDACNRPQGWAPTNSPRALCLRRSPPRGRLVCLGGAHAIAHRGGLLRTALMHCVCVGAHPVGDFPIFNSGFFG